MPNAIYRRDLLLALGAAGLATTVGCASAPPLTPAAPVAPPPPPAPVPTASAKIVYFAQFGVDEAMIDEALGAALARAVTTPTRSSSTGCRAR